MTERFVALSGCSGGGKSTLLAELARRGFATVEEPGRRIVQEEMRSGGQAMPWVDKTAFARRAIGVALDDLKAAQDRPGWVFFDRGLVDAACALEHATGERLEDVLTARRYHPTVFLVPPWREIFVVDAERQHGFEAAVEEYERLQRAYAVAGYRPVILPTATVAERVNLVLAGLAAAPY
jgi:predicted ATPase